MVAPRTVDPESEPRRASSARTGGASGGCFPTSPSEHGSPGLLYDGRMARTMAVLLMTGFVCGGSALSATLPAVPFASVDATPDRVQSAAEQIVASFAAAVNELLGQTVLAPSVEVRNTPNLAYFDHRSWTIVLAHWPTLDQASRGFFLEVAETAEDAAALFVGLFNEFLVAHEMAHWFHRAVGIELDRYSSERQANDIAAGFFLSSEAGEARLLALRPRLEEALARLSDPTPPGAREMDFFNAQYAALARNPYLYGYYQFSFILDSIDRRNELDFASLLRDAPAK